VTTALEELNAAECELLLRDRHFGRLAFVGHEGDLPMIIPVNYVFHAGAVVLRSDEGSKLRAALSDSPAAFEIDGVDDSRRTGWSVVARGHVEAVTADSDLAELRKLPLVTLAPGGRPHYIRLKPAMITGRRISIVDLPSNWWG
jgi:uncharacterized protein